MSRRCQESALSVSLFPFLAVLVCAMGALILLLLIITRQVRSQATMKASVERTETIVTSNLLLPLVHPAQFEALEQYAPSDLPRFLVYQPIASDAKNFDEQQDGDQAKIELLKQQKEELDNSRLQQKLIQMQMAELTARLAKEQQQQQNLKTRFVSLTQRKKHLEDKKSNKKTVSKQSSNQLKQLQTQLLKKQQELKEQKQIASDIIGKLTIVTYDGATGIRRKPIFIECTAGKVVFQPEQVHLTSKDLEAYSPANHPLGFATRALNEYRNRKSASQDSAYVLLVVRPDGINEFYSTRRILGVQDITFGYELVGQTQELYFNQPDSLARKVLEDAIAHARQSTKQKQPGGFQLAGNGKFPGETERPKNRTPSGRGNHFPNTKGGFRSTGKVKNGTNGQNPKRNITKKNGRHGAGTLPSRNNPSSGLQGDWKSSKPSESNSPQKSSRQSSSVASTPKEQLEKMLSQGQRMGNPTKFPQLNSLSSRAKQLKRGSPDPLISFERQIPIKINPGSLQVGKQEPVLISEFESQIETQRKFLNSLEREMSKWPDPPRGFRWVPGFQLVVTPGGNQIAFRIDAVAKELKLRTETNFQMGRNNTNNKFQLK